MAIRDNLKNISILLLVLATLVFFQNCEFSSDSKPKDSLHDQDHVNRSSGNGDIYTGKGSLISNEAGLYTPRLPSELILSRNFYRILEDFECDTNAPVPFESSIQGDSSGASYNDCKGNQLSNIDFKIVPYNDLYLSSNEKIYELFSNPPELGVPSYNELLCRVKGSQLVGTDFIIKRLRNGNLNAKLVVGQQSSEGRFAKRVVPNFAIKKVVIDGLTYYYSPVYQFLIETKIVNSAPETSRAKYLLDENYHDKDIECFHNPPAIKDYDIEEPSGQAETCSSEADWCIGANQVHKVPSDVLGNHEKSSLIQDGDIIEILPGTYSDTAVVRRDNVVLRSVPGTIAKIDCSGMRPFQSKSCLFAQGNAVTFQDLIVTGARWVDKNEACLRNKPGQKTYVKNLVCYGSNNGILGSGGDWMIEDSLFHHNGNADQPDKTHNLNFAPSGEFSCENVHLLRVVSRDPAFEAAVKSRCSNLVIEESTIIDGYSGRALDSSFGGEVLIKNSTIIQPISSNNTIIDHGPENCDIPGELTLDNVILINHNSTGRVRSLCGEIHQTNGTTIQGVVDFITPDN